MFTIKDIHVKESLRFLRLPKQVRDRSCEKTLLGGVSIFIFDQVFFHKLNTLARNQQQKTSNGLHLISILNTLNL